MDPLQGIGFGFSRAFEPQILIMCLLGVAWGTMIGVLPGIGPIGGMTMLIPLTFGMDVTTSMVMLFGIYYGTMYGGSTTSILLAVPGESTSMVTILDGHQMALKGRAGAALSIAAIGSFIAGTVGICGLAFLAPPLASLALGFAPPEYFSLALLALTMSAFITSSGAMLKGLSMVIVGLMVSTVGMHIVTGNQRYTFDMMELSSGIELVAVFMGLFGIAEVLDMIGNSSPRIIHTENLYDLKRLLPTRTELGRSLPAMIRGSFIGFFMGTAPGGGGDVSTYVTYAVEKRISKHPEEFGRGAPEGVAAPESANNAGAFGQMIVLLTLGVPFGVISGIMLNAMIAHGIYPSPLLLDRNPEFFWTVVSSMYIGNFALLVLNLPLVGVWASLLRLPQRWLLTLIVLFCFVGVYTVNYNSFDLVVMVLFGVIGLFMKRVKLPVIPIALGLVLGPVLENALGQSLILSKGSPAIFFTRPVSAVLMVIIVAVVVVLPLTQRLLGRRLAIQTVEAEM